MNIKEFLLKLIGHNCKIESKYPLSQIPYRVGNWIVENNPPYGMVVTNSTYPRHSFHFFNDSHGWCSGSFILKEGAEPETVAFDSRANKMPSPVLVDKKSIRIYDRIKYLQNLKVRTFDESEELLNLLGATKKKNTVLA